MPYLSQETKKGLFISWSNDDNSESELEDEAAKHVTSLTGRYESDEDSCDEELSYEELAAFYIELCIRNEEVCKLGENKIKLYLNCRLKKKDFNSPSLISKMK